MGTDNYRHAADARRDHTRRRAVSQRRARHHHAGAGPHHRATLDQDRGGRPQGGAGARGAQGRHREDLGRHPRRQVQETDPRSLRRRSSTRRTSATCASRRTSSTWRTRRADARRPRRVRARRPRQGHRRRNGGDVQAAPEPGADAEPAGPRREGRSELAAGRHAGRRRGQSRKDQHRPAAGAGVLRHPGAQPGEAECGGRADRARDRRQSAVGTARGDGRTW